MLGGGVGEGGKKDGRTDRGFKEAVPALVSLSCSPAQVYRSKGASHLEEAWAGKQVEFGSLEGVFPSPARQTVRKAGLQIETKTKSVIQGIVTGNHIHSSGRGNGNTRACVWKGKHFIVSRFMGVCLLAGIVAQNVPASCVVWAQVCSTREGIPCLPSQLLNREDPPRP